MNLQNWRKWSLGILAMSYVFVLALLALMRETPEMRADWSGLVYFASGIVSILVVVISGNVLEHKAKANSGKPVDSAPIG